MTPEQQRIAIAEACDWQQKSVDPEYPLTRPEGRWEKGELTIYHHGQLPDYLNDLNAMHEAEKSLTDRQHLTFRKQLWDVVIQNKHDDEWDRCWISATAAQRAEAFLRTLNLWKD